MGACATLNGVNRVRLARSCIRIRFASSRLQASGAASESRFTSPSCSCGSVVAVVGEAVVVAVAPSVVVVVELLPSVVAEPDSL